MKSGQPNLKNKDVDFITSKRRGDMKPPFAKILTFSFYKKNNKKSFFTNL